MSDELSPDTFVVAVDYQEMPGKVVVTEVILQRRVVDRDVFDAARHRVHLCTHPLYSRLCMYVANNDPGKQSDYIIMRRGGKV